MKNKIGVIRDWFKEFSKRSYRFWFETTISEERLRRLRNEHRDLYYRSNGM